MYRYSMLCAVLAGLLWQPNLWADPYEQPIAGQNAHAGKFIQRARGTAWGQGSLSLGFTAEGLLSRCGEPPVHFPFAHRVVIKTVFARFDGVCDDQSERPCSGRLTQITERCTADDVHYQLTENQGVDYARSRVRVCFDPSAEGNCDDVDEVASGYMYSHIPGNFSTNPSLEGTFDQTSESENIHQITRSKMFNLEGRHVKISKRGRTGGGTTRVSSSCLFQNNACPSILRLEEAH